MSKLSSFLRKFAPEYRALAGSLGTIALGIALNPAERDAVLKVSQTIGNAADSIEAHLQEVQQAEAAGIDKEALRAAMKELIPDIIGGMSEAAIRAIFESRAEVKTAVKARNAKIAKEGKS